MIPIYIPSRARAYTATTPGLLDRAGFLYTIVVEPHEYADYAKAFPKGNTLSLPRSHQGIAYVRQYMLQTAYERGETWYWQIDDDMRGFWQHENGTCERTDARVLEKAAVVIAADERLAQFGMVRRDAKWKLVKPYERNVGCYGVVCMHAPKVIEAAHYRDGVFEDGDMSLQLLSCGYHTFRWCCYASDSPLCGVGEGGQHDFYTSRKDAAWANNLRSIWGTDLIHISTKTSGRTVVNIRWGYFSEKSLLKRSEK